MKAITGALAAALFVSFVTPVAQAAPTRQERVSPELAIAGADAAIGAYGEWLQQLQAAQAPLMEAFSRLGARFQPGRLGSIPSLMAEVEATRALARTTAERVRAIQAPDISGLPLPDEVQPATMQREQLLAIAQIERVAALLLESLQAAGRGDRSAATRALDAVFASVETLLQQRILFSRAMLAVVPRGESSWEIGNSELLTLRSASKMLALFANASARTGAAGMELVALADEFASTRRSAAIKMEAEAAEVAAAENSLRSMPGGARLLRRVQSFEAIGPRYLELMDEWERLLRDAAQIVPDRSVSQQELSSRLIPRFSVLRERGDRLLSELGAAMASD